MIKVKIGGYPFHCPQNWGDVPYEKAVAISQTSREQIRERVQILCDVPSMRLTFEVVNTLYEIIGFVEEIPELTTNKTEVRPFTKWSYMEFENVRRLIQGHEEELGVCLAPSARIFDGDDNYVEVGSKVLDELYKLYKQFENSPIFESDGITPEEQSAGIERLQAFGAYGILQAVGRKYAMPPIVVEREPVVWVLQEFWYQIEEGNYQHNLQKGKG